MLSSLGTTDADVLVQFRLQRLNTHLLRLNVRIGHLEGPKDQDSPIRWDTSLFSKLTAREADQGGRLVERVSLHCKDAARYDQNRRLQPLKITMFLVVRSTVAYINTAPEVVRWRQTEFTA